MKNVKSFSLLLAYTLIALIFTALVYPKSALATETDPYTYSYIPLQDSSLKLNAKVNGLFYFIFDDINQRILSGKKYSDTYIEWNFSYLYYHEMFEGNLVADAFSSFETCIDSNGCKNWPYFERVFLYPSESIYAEADYSDISKKYISSTINLCGVRIGTDKLSHFFKDGFQLYNASKDSDYNLTEQDILNYSIIYEQTVMGSTFTGVFSNADIRANIKGAKFFKDLFENNLVRKKDGTVILKPIDICKYFDKYFDESVMKNKYTEAPVHVARLMGVIEKRLADKSQPITREEMLARKPEIGTVTRYEQFVAGLKVLSPKLFSSSVRNALSILEIEPYYQNRLETKIPKQK